MGSVDRQRQRRLEEFPWPRRPCPHRRGHPAGLEARRPRPRGRRHRRGRRRPRRHTDRRGQVRLRPAVDGRRRLHHEDRSRGGRRPVLPRHGQHDLRGLVRLGRWTHWYFGPYIVIWGFVYGAAAMAGTGLPLHSLLPVLPVWAWGILSGLIGLALVWWGRYSLFEKVCAALVGIMFVTMVGAALLTLPNIPELVTGLVPLIPTPAWSTCSRSPGRRRHHHPGGLRLLDPGEGLDHPGPHAGHACRQHGGLRRHGHLRDRHPHRGRGAALLREHRRRRATRASSTSPPSSPTATATGPARCSSSASGQPPCPRSWACGTASR